MKEITYSIIEEACKGLAGIDVKGKNYIQVNERIKAFRKVYPTGRITTDILTLENGIVTMQTTVADEEGKILATGLAQEKESSSYINKTSYIENCETSAIGRALGMCGFGIDNNIASAEELVNAITNQEKANKMKFQEAQPVEEKSKEATDTIYSLAKKKGVPVTKLFKKYAVTQLSLLTEDQRKECIEGLSGMPDVEKKEAETA
jgi:hypothetical protein